MSERGLLAPALAATLALAGCAPAKAPSAPQAPREQAAKAADPLVNPAPRLGLGRPLGGDEIARISISVAPDGTGLPPGRGGVAEGARVYAEQCAACHGEKGEGSGDYPALVGGRGTLASARPVQTVGSFWPYATTVFDYIHRAMPYGAPGSLTPDQTYAVTAWILAENGVVGRDAVLGRENLARVRMPNRDGLVADPRNTRRDAY